MYPIFSNPSKVYWMPLTPVNGVTSWKIAIQDILILFRTKVKQIIYKHISFYITQGCHTHFKYNSKK